MLWTNPVNRNTSGDLWKGMWRSEPAANPPSFCNALGGMKNEVGTDREGRKGKLGAGDYFYEA